MDTISKPLKYNKAYALALRIGQKACHQKAERSFFWGRRKYPVCARCTGIYLATPVGLLLGFYEVTSPWIYATFLIPVVADGVTQLLTSYESTNIKRLLTGLLFGVGYGGLLAWGTMLLLGLLF